MSVSLDIKFVMRSKNFSLKKLIRNIGRVTGFAKNKHSSLPSALVGSLFKKTTTLSCQFVKDVTTHCDKGAIN